MSSTFIEKANEAVDINAASGIDIGLTSHGSDWYWTLFSVFGVLTFGHATLFQLKKERKITFIGPLIAAAIEFFVYFTMASNLGWTGIQLEFNHATVDDSSVIPGIRQVFYARYIGWFLAYPALLFAIELLAHEENLTFNLKTLSTLLVSICSYEVFTLGLLIGMLIKSTYKWGYFTFAVVAELFAIGVTYHRMIVYLNTPKKILFLYGFMSLIWILYPVAWGLSEGGNVIQPDSEAAFYGVLDLIMFGCVPLVLAYITDKTDNELTYPKQEEEQREKVIPPAEERHSGETEVPEVPEVTV